MHLSLSSGGAGLSIRGPPNGGMFRVGFHGFVESQCNVEFTFLNTESEFSFQEIFEGKLFSGVIRCWFNSRLMREQYLSRRKVMAEPLPDRSKGAASSGNFTNPLMRNVSYRSGFLPAPVAKVLLPLPWIKSLGPSSQATDSSSTPPGILLHHRAAAGTGASARNFNKGCAFELSAEPILKTSGNCG